MDQAVNANIIAVCGGGRISQLGHANDIQVFFGCIDRYAGDVLDQTGRHLILDRLYKRYLRLEETAPAAAAMITVQRHFAKIPTASIDWAALGLQPETSEFKLGLDTAGAVFDERGYFRRFQGCVNSVLYRHEHGETFFPIMLSRSDFESIRHAETRPREEYDTLDGPPFWLATPSPPQPAPSYKDGKEVPHGTPGSIRPDHVSDDGKSAAFTVKLSDFTGPK